VALWVKLVATMGPDELTDFDERTFKQWDRASLGELRRAIERRRRQLGRLNGASAWLTSLRKGARRRSLAGFRRQRRSGALARAARRY
jgi:hypothetical protein